MTTTDGDGNPLQALVSIISSSVRDLESIYAKRNAAFPSLDQPFSPTPLDSEASVLEAAHLIVAAASQLIAAVRPPEETIRELAPSMYVSGALGFVVETNVPDILGEAGPQGIHATDIAKITGTDPTHLARVLRFLATRHVFREVTPNVFANNRISSAMIKGNRKSLQELKESPDNQYNDAGTAAFVGHVTDEGLKSSAYMIDYLKNPKSGEAAPFNVALHTKSTMWQYFEMPENAPRLRRFMAVMTKDGGQFKDSFFCGALDWAALKPSDVVVDVGGNLGTVTLSLLSQFPDPQYVIQDLPSVIPGAKKFWQGVNPGAITDGKVKLQGHDFFQPQPIKSASVYFLRFILHDWADDQCIQILKSIREAAGPSSSKLVLFEFCVPYACEDLDPEHGSMSKDIVKKKAPWPILANWGMGGGAYPTFVDLQMMNLFNGQERTLGEFIDLGKKTGWKLESVKTEVLTAFVFSPT